MLRRLVPLALIASLLGAMVPSPALAMSTQTEIAEGRVYDQQIVEGSVIENDPLLNQWVQGIASKLWAQTARKDVPYSIKIIDDSTINAFSTLGGYVYVDEGILDFVQSDDELAGVIGHETGHIERRHEVTMQTKSTILSILTTIGALLSPIVYNFGNLIDAGILAKIQRTDELQADQYGLLLMSRAGYDPEAMLTMLQHLGAMGEHNDLVSKYFADHPGVQARIAHLLGYSELDPTKTTPQQRLVWALHDLADCRYSVANLEFDKILAKEPANTQALLAQSRAELALGLTAKSEQTLGELAQNSSPAVKADARARITALRSMEAHQADLLQPDTSSLRAKLQHASQLQTQTVAQVSARHDEGDSQLKAVQARVQQLQYEVPNLGNVQVRHGSKLEAVLKNFTAMGRSLDYALDNDEQAIERTGWTDRKTGKPGGLLQEQAQTLADMDAPLKVSPIPSDSVAVFPEYPEMLRELRESDGEMVGAIDAGRASAMQLDMALGDVDAFIKRLEQSQLNAFGDIDVYDYNDLVPLVKKAQTALDQAATSSSQAVQLYNMARAHQLAPQITMLGLGASPARYDSLRKAINVRWNVDDLSYIDMLRRNLTPGQVAEASIIAADLNSTPKAVLREARQKHQSIVDVANAHGMHAISLEIFMGLLYLDYTDNPTKEAQPLTQTAPNPAQV